VKQQYEENKDWKLLFHPKGFAKDKDFDLLTSWTLNADKLHKFAKMTTKLRADIRKRAIKMAEKEGHQFSTSETKVAKVIKLTSRGHYDNQELARKAHFSGTGMEKTPTLLRKRTKKRNLNLDDKIEIAWKVFMEKEKQADVARHFRMTTPAISRFTSMLRKKPSMLGELLSKNQTRAAETKKIGDIIQKMVDEN
jgi:hypothetical protein